MTQVKICGVNSDAAFNAAALADFVGLVFFPPSPRFVTPAQAAALSARRPGGPKRIGLFVTPTDEEIAAVLAAVPLDGLQLYTDATRARDLRGKFGLPTWRAVGVAAPSDLPVDEGLDGNVIEPKPLPNATRPGGNAVTLDWAVLKGWRAPGFWLLGGGLNPENVSGAIKTANPPGVDVSSGVETAPGEKSPNLIRQFITAASKPRVNF